MEIKTAITAFAALAQETRLEAMRALIEYGEEGAPAGMLSERLGVPQNTLSFHLQQLSQAGLVSSRREGRHIIYQATFSTVKGLSDFLLQNCCVKTKKSCTKTKC